MDDHSGPWLSNHDGITQFVTRRGPLVTSPAIQQWVESAPTQPVPVLPMPAMGFEAAFAIEPDPREPTPVFDGLLAVWEGELPEELTSRSDGG